MVVEYLLLLSISIMIIAGSFGLNTGPVKMFQLKSPSLACLIEQKLETGHGFKPGYWKTNPKAKTKSAKPCPEA